jgi:hypothetical protein
MEHIDHKEIPRSEFFNRASVKRLHPKGYVGEVLDLVLTQSKTLAIPFPSRRQARSFMSHLIRTIGPGKLSSYVKDTTLYLTSRSE